MLELTETELTEIDGGLIGGAFVGGILGGTAGLFATTVYGVSTGSLSGNALWKGTVTGALSGAAYGAYTPV